MGYGQRHFARPAASAFSAFQTKVLPVWKALKSIVTAAEELGIEDEVMPLAEYAQMLVDNNDELMCHPTERARGTQARSPKFYDDFREAMNNGDTERLNHGRNGKSVRGIRVHPGAGDETTQHESVNFIANGAAQHVVELTSRFAGHRQAFETVYRNCGSPEVREAIDQVCIALQQRLIEQERSVGR